MPTQVLETVSKNPRVVLKQLHRPSWELNQKDSLGNDLDGQMREGQTGQEAAAVANGKRLEQEYPVPS